MDPMDPTMMRQRPRVGLTPLAQPAPIPMAPAAPVSRDNSAAIAAALRGGGGNIDSWQAGLGSAIRQFSAAGLIRQQQEAEAAKERAAQAQREALAKMLSDPSADPLNIAGAYARTGDQDTAYKFYERAKPKKETPQIVKGADGYSYWAVPGQEPVRVIPGATAKPEGRPIRLLSPDGKTFRTVRETSAEMDKLISDGWNYDPKATTEVTQTVGGGDKLYEEMDKEQGKMFGALSKAGIEAGTKLGQIDQLESVLGGVNTGAGAAVQQLAGEWGINTEGLDNIQAAQAIINRLVPEQRQPGSGPMSDADLELFKQSLPRLLNQPGGNKIIINTMRGIAQYEQALGAIADQVANREITPKDARDAMRALENPLSAFRKGAKSDDPAATSADDLKKKYGLE